MRLPNHIVLDFYTNNNNNTVKYWPTYVIEGSGSIPLFLNNQFIVEKLSNNNFSNIKIFRIKKYNLDYNVKNLQNLLQLVNTPKKNNKSSKISTLINSINIIFLRKEPIYTKLKYSRTAAYDIVGGGSALFLAGLLGFLVSEKFGIELVDSGDFYYLFMYVVFLAFAIRPLLTVINPKHSLIHALNVKAILEFYNTIIYYILNIFK